MQRVFIVVWCGLLAGGCVGEVEQRQYVSDMASPRHEEDLGTEDLPNGLDMQPEQMIDQGGMGRDLGQPPGFDMADLVTALDLAGDMVDMMDAGPEMGGPVEEDMAPSFVGERSAVFTKAGCMPGCAGEQVRYTSRQHSMISVEDAERLAHLDVMAQGQAHADVMGACECMPQSCGCEDFRNHGPGSPHLYYDAGRQVYVGDVIAQCPPLFRIDGLMTDYEPMRLTGSIANSSKNVYHYTVPADATGRNTHVKSVGQACMNYPDVRVQPQDTRTHSEWITLPTLPPVTPSSRTWPMFVASELEHAEPNGTSFVWGMFVPGSGFGPLQYRVDGGAWQNFKAPETWGAFVAAPSFEVTPTETFKPAKDFIIDVTDDGGATAQRFTVFRTSTGGHYAVVATMTRQDGHVWINSQLVNPETSQYLVHHETGHLYRSAEPYHHLFDMGQLDDGEHHFALFSAQDMLLAPDVLVRVKRTP